MLVPLAFNAKGPLREFDARDGNCNPMPIVGTQDTWKYGILMVLSALSHDSVPVSEELREVVQEIVGPRVSGDDMAEVDLFLRTGRWKGGQPMNVAALANSTAGALLRELTAGFLLVGVIDSTDSGKRQVLKYSYDWFIEDADDAGPAGSWKVAGGWSTRTLALPLEAPSAAKSYHLEFQTPTDAQCRLLRLPTADGAAVLPSMIDDSGRPVMHVHASYRTTPGGDGALVVELTRGGIRMVAFLAAVFTAVMITLALTLQDAEAVWRADPDGPVTVLLVAPAVLFTYLASRGESALIRRPVSILRSIIFSSGVSLFLVAASLVGELNSPYVEGLWWLVVFWNAAAAIFLMGGPIMRALDWLRAKQAARSVSA